MSVSGVAMNLMLVGLVDQHDKLDSAILYYTAFHLLVMQVHGMHCSIKSLKILLMRIRKCRFSFLLSQEIAATFSRQKSELCCYYCFWEAITATTTTNINMVKKQEF